MYTGEVLTRFLLVAETVSLTSTAARPGRTSRHVPRGQQPSPKPALGPCLSSETQISQLFLTMGMATDSRAISQWSTLHVAPPAVSNFALEESNYCHLTVPKQQQALLRAGRAVILFPGEH